MDDPDPKPADDRTAVFPRPPSPPEPVLVAPPAAGSGLGHVGHFRLQYELGQGGCGVVYRAFDEKLERVVAVKTLLPAVAGSAEVRERFVREARAAAAVRHENVVQIHAVAEAAPPYIVMEYVPGGSLHRHLTEHGPRPPAEVLRIGVQVARGLAAAHERGLVHRDIKPGNILLEWADGDPRVKLTDFGLALAADDPRLTRTGTVVGTPLYMSPEQARGEPVDGRSDLFSLGSVMFEMATGLPPFAGANSNALLGRVAAGGVRPLREVVPDAPDWLCAIVGRLQAPKPGERFGSAREVADLLDRCLADLDRGSRVRLPRGVARRRRPLRPAVALAFLAVGVGAGVFGYVRLTRDGTAADPGTVAETPATPAAVVAPAAPDEGRPADRYVNAYGMTFARIPRGTAPLGGPTSGRSITVPADFFLGVYEVTRQDWERVLGAGSCPADPPAGVPADEVPRLPVTGVSWDDCQMFLRAINRQVPEPGWTYRLPQAGEWEYACRGGPDADRACGYFAGEPSPEPHPERMNCKEGGPGRPVPVGRYPAHRLGLHDMHGNALELLDSANGEVRWLTGGCWTDEAAKMRAGTFFGVHHSHRLAGAGLRVARVSGDPADPQAGSADPNSEAVIGAIRQHNPRFLGDVTVKMADGYVREVIVTGAGLTDLTPFATFSRTTSLSLPGAGVKDLDPLRGLPLQALSLWGFAGTDLAPLKGMPLKELNCGGGGKKLDLTPLTGMPLRVLGLNHTQVSDLAPLKGMPLEQLMIGPTKVTDLAPLADMTTLRRLHIDGTPVADLRPVAALPLEVLDFDYVPARDAEVVRAMATLKEVNKKPVAKWWSTAPKE